VIRRHVTVGGSSKSALQGRTAPDARTDRIDARKCRNVDVSKCRIGRKVRQAGDRKCCQRKQVWASAPESANSQDARAAGEPGARVVPRKFGLVLPSQPLGVLDQWLRGLSKTARAGAQHSGRLIGAASIESAGAQGDAGSKSAPFLARKVHHPSLEKQNHSSLENQTVPRSKSKPFREECR
jgi:hypothetical protein